MAKNSSKRPKPMSPKAGGTKGGKRYSCGGKMSKKK